MTVTRTKKTQKAGDLPMTHVSIGSSCIDTSSSPDSQSKGRAPLGRRLLGALAAHVGASRAVASIAILAALAVGLLLSSVGPLQAQEAVDYPENGTDAVATFTATDPEGSAVSWTLATGGADNGLFMIEDGVLTFVTPPDYEEADQDNMHEVTVEATDSTGNTAMRTVMVKVTNVDEDGTVAIRVRVNDATTGQPVLQPQVGTVLTASLTDEDVVPAGTGGDPNPEWQWYRGSTEISGATNAEYKPVEADVGNRLTAKATYMDIEDADNEKEAEVRTLRAVRAAPGSNTAPRFPDRDLTMPDVQKNQDREVEENTPAGMNIGDPVAANDAGDVLAYSLSGPAAAMFDIDIATGQLKTKEKLNREGSGGGQRVVTVTAVDPFGITDEAAVTIEVTNVDEAPTIGAAAKAMIMHPEPVPPAENGDVPAPVPLAEYMATDDEDDVGDAPLPLTWSLKGADKDLFTIAEGMLMFMSNPDFEKAADAGENNVYEVTVVVTDSGDLTDELAVRVEVTNVNEAGEVTFSVNAPRIGVPVTAMLDDPDGGETGHEWQWMVAADDAGAADDAKTEIEDATSATYTPRDEDMGKFLSVNVEYTDGKGEDEAEGELADDAVAESASPRFYDKVFTEDTRKAITEFEIELDENTVDVVDNKMAPIYVDHRTDDVATVLRYTVSGTDMASFEIVTGNATTRQVNLKATGLLDYEDKSSYIVTVTATDSDGLSASLPVTITVDDLEEKPKLEGDDPEDYPENGTGAVATFTATDPEGSAVSWTLATGGADNGLFMIEDGVLTFVTPPDYEEADQDNMHEVTVEATDSTGNTAMRTVMVKVTNVDEDGTVMIRVRVNDATTGQPVLQPQVGTVLTASLTDEDVVPAGTGDDPNPEWQWYRGSTEISGATNAEYKPVEADVDNRLTAKATYMDIEDADNEKEAEVRTLRAVRAAPGSNTVPGFPDQDTSTLDSVEKAQKRKVEENTPAGMNIGDPVAANDAGDVLAYSLSGPAAAMFDIDIATGQLKTKGKLNREGSGGGQRVVTVTAVDPFGITDEAAVTIEVTNVDEAPTIGAAAKAMIMHPEPVPAENGDVPAPVALATYTATDDEDDTAAVNTDLTWSLKGADKDLLAIDAEGMLMFMSNPDFEKAGDAGENNVYEVTVVVTDSGDLTDELAVRVEVTNVNEAGEVTFSVNAPRIAVPVTAMLDDPDGGEAGHEWQWMVADSADDAKTEIEDATSATFVPRDEDMGMFLSVKVEYTDGKGEDEAEAEFGTAVAESASPRFYDKVFTEDTRKAITEFEIELAENTVDDAVLKMGQIHVVHRTDNVTAVLRYAVGGTDSAAFEIDTTGGRVDLKATGQLDHEDKASYSVTVTATDSDANSASIDVTVKVTEVDEKPVIMVGGLAISGMTSVDYAEDRHDAVATYKASGPDAASAMWSLSGDDDGDFTITTGGELAFSSAPDFENPADTGEDNGYQVTVVANDGTYMDTHDVTVTVTDVDDEQPQTLLARYDDNNSGRIDKDELVNAVFDYNINRTLSKASLVELIFSYEIG